MCVCLLFIEIIQFERNYIMCIWDLRCLLELLVVGKNLNWLEYACFFLN